MLPILIGFIASVLGIGGIGEKMRSIIAKLQKPVMKAVDFVIKTGLKLAGPIIRGLKGIGAKAKAKIASGKAYVKGKVEAGKKYVKGKVDAGLAALRRAIFDRLGRRRAVPMKGKSHHVYVEKRGGSYRVMMASTATELLARIDRAMANPRVKSLGLSGKISGARSSVVAAESRFKHFWGIGDDRKAISKAEYELKETVDRVELDLVDLGKSFDITELTGGKYVLDDKVHPDFQHRTRLEFYGPRSAYSGHTKAKLKDAFTAKAKLYPNPLDHPDKFWCPGVKNGKHKKPAHLASVKDGYAVDHKTGVATHWKTLGGNNTTQGVREQWYGDPNNLEILCRDCNGTKQSEGDQFTPFDVGPNFSGPGGMR
jgi:hypothetical protein